jgi:hypothetical protein
VLGNRWYHVEARPLGSARPIIDRTLSASQLERYNRLRATRGRTAEINLMAVAVVKELPLRAKLVLYGLKEKTNREKTKVATMGLEGHEIRRPQKSAAPD